MGMSALVPHYTAEELRRFPEDGLRYEVIRGELFVTPGPGTVHQRLVLALARGLADYVDRYELGETFLGPFEVEFADDTAVQPDVLVLLHDRAGQLTPARLMGPPSLVVEVVSYSSKRIDRLQKRALYMDDGVAEYWVAEPGLRRVERWVPGAEAPELLSDRLTWAPRGGLDPLVVDLVALFDRATR